MTICEMCGVDSSSLEQHKRDVHLKNILCECCDKVFSRPCNLKVHLKNKAAKAEGPPRLTCHKCGKTCGSNYCEKNNEEC